MYISALEMTRSTTFTKTLNIETMIDLKKNKGNYLTYDEYRITLDRLRMDRMCIEELFSCWLSTRD